MRFIEATELEKALLDRDSSIGNYFSYPKLQMTYLGY